MIDEHAPCLVCGEPEYRDHCVNPDCMRYNPEYARIAITTED